MKNSKINFDIQELHIKHDKETGFIGIVAINDLSRGPALGGCRCINYKFFEDAIIDAIKLAKTMNYKLAIYGIPFSGGKIVLVKPHVIDNPESYFQILGRFVKELNGKIITGCDIGVTTKDMAIAATQTRYIVASSESADLLSHFTTMGLFRSCEAAIKFKLNKDSMKGIRLAIQGVGKIGYSFVKMAHEHGAIITICDADPLKVEKCVNELGVKSVQPDEIFRQNCDIFSPCSLGGVINNDTIDLLKAKIICGGANNQLADNDVGELLLKKDILYVPDFVANGGGAVYAAGSYLKIDEEKLKQYLLQKSYETCMLIFTRSKDENLTTNKVAENIAEEKIRSWQKNKEKSPFSGVDDME